MLFIVYLPKTTVSILDANYCNINGSCRPILPQPNCKGLVQITPDILYKMQTKNWYPLSNGSVMKVNFIYELYFMYIFMYTQ